MESLNQRIIFFFSCIYHWLLFAKSLEASLCAVNNSKQAPVWYLHLNFRGQHLFSLHLFLCLIWKKNPNESDKSSHWGKLWVFWCRLRVASVASRFRDDADARLSQLEESRSQTQARKNLKKKKNKLRKKKIQISSWTFLQSELHANRALRCISHIDMSWLKNGEIRGMKKIRDMRNVERDRHMKGAERWHLGPLD